MGAAINQSAGGCQCVSGPVGCPSCPSFTLRNLSVSWTNVQTGGGSSGMTWVSGCLWDTFCTPSNLRIQFDMSAATPVLTVYRYSGAGCATLLGSCSFTTPDISACSPLQFSWGVTNANCPGLYSGGYSRFTVTQ